MPMRPTLLDEGSPSLPNRYLPRRSWPLDFILGTSRFMPAISAPMPSPSSDALTSEYAPPLRSNRPLTPVFVGRSSAKEVRRDGLNCLSVSHDLMCVWVPGVTEAPWHSSAISYLPSKALLDTRFMLEHNHAQPLTSAGTRMAQSSTPFLACNASNSNGDVLNADDTATDDIPAGAWYRLAR